jgi:hypothetical protein
MESRKLPSQNLDLSALTSIRDMYTLSPTQEGSSEADRIMIDNFIHALAEISLSIASRKQGKAE